MKRGRAAPSSLAALCGIILVLSVGRTLGAQAAPTLLRAEFWTDLDGVPREGEPYPLSDAIAAARVLDEAAWVFSGMVNGFDFDWTPENKGRQVKEEFVFTPIGTIAHGDPRLRPGETARTGSRLSAWIDFRPDDADILSLQIPLSATWQSGQGAGAVRRSLGYAGRREAYAAAAKSAIEAWARSVMPARPREVKGRLVFASAPRVAVVEDSWQVMARVRFSILEIRRQSMF